MKSNKPTTLILSILMSICVNAQTIPIGQELRNYEYSNENLGVAASTLPTPLKCGTTNTPILPRYGEKEGWIPDSNTPIKTIKIAFHFFQKTDGSNCWQNNAFNINRLNQIVSWMNGFHSNIWGPSDPILGVPFIGDSRIRFEVTGYYFYRNDTLNAEGGSYTPLRDAVFAIDSSRLTSFPIYVTGGTYSNAAGFTNFPSFTQLNMDMGILTFNNEADPQGDWAFAGHLHHEFGHDLTLRHTYNINLPETVYKLDSEYLSDVFEQPWQYFCSPPTNYSCHHLGGWNVDPYAVPENYRTNNIMGGAGYNTYISPKQLGRMHRALSLSSMRKYVKSETSSPNLWVVNTNETWDFDVRMYQDIVVKSGSTLTITCRVGMANGGRIIVERGAKLIINGGEVYAWDKNWAGIQVWGTSSQRQMISSNGYSANHGIVQVINQGTLRDAIDAITTIKYDENGNWDWGGYTGGIIMCDGAKFINNRRAIQYLTYHNFNPSNGNIIDNIGYIRRSTLETNAALKSGADPEVFISMWDVQGVKLYGNTYKNSISPLPSIESRGNGINSIDASYYLDRYKVCSVINSQTGQCAGYSVNNASIFTNLHYGVKVQNSTPLTNIKINDNDFIGCNRGVYIGGTYNTKITNNRINVGDGINIGDFLPYGIYSENSSAYDISNNTIFTTQTTNNALSLATGIVVNGTNGYSNMLYRNTINMMSCGTTVYGNNQGLSAGDGLKFKCNQFGQGTNGKNYIDLNMGYNSSVGTAKIDIYQGTPSSGANNLFSHTGNSLASIKSDFSDLYHTASQIGTINYFFNPTPGQLSQPWYYDNSMLPPVSLGLNLSSNMCPAEQLNGGGGTASAAKTIISNNTSKIASLLLKIDGNQTSFLLNSINSNMSSGNLKNLLEKYSPYLSDEVLIAYFSKSSIPYGHIKDIHDKNKPVSPTVWQVIEDKNLPTGIKKNITEQQFASAKISEMNKLIGEVADLKQEKAIFVDQTISNLMSDSVNGWNKDSILEIMKFDDRYDAACRLLAAYVSLNEFSKATLLANEMKQAEGGTLEAFCKLQELLIVLKQQVKNIYDIKTDPSKQEIVEMIVADKENGAYSNAQAILSKVYGYTYHEFIDLPSFNNVSNNNRLFKSNEENGNFQELSKSFKLYPNPSNGNTNILYMSDENIVQAEIQIFDITGKLVIKQSIKVNSSTNIVETEFLRSGLYLVNLLIDNKVIDRQKLIKQ